MGLAPCLLSEHREAVNKSNLKIKLEADSREAFQPQV